jgi:hypothetical protein
VLVIIVVIFCEDFAYGYLFAIASLRVVVFQILLDFYWSLCYLLLSVACEMVSSLMMATLALQIQLNISQLLLPQL